jgi:ABC-type antimicrobial peptide transport system permease subunit
MAPDELLRLAVQTLVRNPGRSVLTMLGLAIGVGAFIAMVSFGEGARRSVVAQFEELGTDIVKIGSWVGRAGAEGRMPQPLLARDVAALRREGTVLERVVPVGRSEAAVTAGSARHNTTVHGAPPDFLVVHNWAVALGGPFDEVDVAQRAKVCLLGMTPAEALFGGDDPLGARVSIQGVLTCQVVGVLEPKGTSTGGHDLDDLVLVPLTTFEAYLGLPFGYAFIEVQPLSPNLLAEAQLEVTEVLRRARHLEPHEPLDFRVSSPAEVVRAAERTSLILQRLLAAIAAVSLLVGGIGIMNIQLVAVAERTREIGIRAAIGASPGHIRTQFLAEALLLSLAGTLVGVASGIAVSLGVAEAMGFARALPASGVVVGALLGLGAGVVFGYVPARRAARLDPIEALRRE